MNTGFSYAMIEGLKGLRRAKFSAFVSVSTIFFSLVLIGIFVVFILNIQRFIAQLQSRMELEVFLDNSYSTEQVEELKKRIITMKGIDSVHYVSKDEAVEIFKQQFGQDIFEILNENPLPASFQIKLQPGYRSATNAQKISKHLGQLDGVDDVFYRQDLLLLLERYLRMFLIAVFSIGLLLGVGAIFWISNTIKLIILSRSNTIQIMKLVGATRRFIRRPFIIEGIVQGLIGGCLAAVFFYLVLNAIKLEIPGLIFIDPQNYLILILLGVLLGFIGSKLALRKFLKY